MACLFFRSATSMAEHVHALIWPYITSYGFNIILSILALHFFLGFNIPSAHIPNTAIDIKI